MSDKEFSVSEFAARLVEIYNEVHVTSGPIRSIVYYGTPQAIVALEDEELEYLITRIRLYRELVRQYGGLPYETKLYVNRWIEQNTPHEVAPPVVFELETKLVD